jgi:oligopeptide/dipeptide ABC transporter ATP-binding protein
MTGSRRLLEVSGLSVAFPGPQGEWVTVVQDVSFHVGEGEVLGLVGESGSGKSVSCLAAMRLGEGRITAGEITFDGTDLRGLNRKALQQVRGRRIAMIFQDPMTSLNPAFTVGQQIVEVLRRHLDLPRRAAWQRAVELLDLVGIPSAQRRSKEYPHTFSGGMRQRVMIAMALACEPKLLIADEPTTALDVTTQTQILQLLRRLRELLGLSIVLVTHDLGVVADMCDRVAVMYAGQIVETGPVHEIFANQRHPYTTGLLRAMPQATPRGQALTPIGGLVPRAGEFADGCRFHPRCPHMMPGPCTTGSPELIALDAGGAIQTRCVRVHELSTTRAAA